MGLSLPSYEDSQDLFSSPNHRDQSGKPGIGATVLAIGQKRMFTRIKEWAQNKLPQRGKQRRTSSSRVDERFTFADTVEESARVRTPQAGSEKHAMTSSANHRMSSSLTPHLETKGSGFLWPVDRRGEARPSNSSERLLPPVPVNPASGTAAKASVAAQKRELRPGSQIQAGVLPTLLNHPRSKSLGRTLARNTESGIDLNEDKGGQEDSAFNVIRIGKQNGTQKIAVRLLLGVDPVNMLPPEIVSTILSYLDATSLARAGRVSHVWLQLAQTKHAWRYAWENDIPSAARNVLSSPNQFQAHGLGLGKGLPDQDWRAMLKARKQLQSRWRRGKAAAIYLEGHTDSVYCVQFDEHKIVTGSRDQTVRVWDAKTYRCVRMLGVPNGSSVTGRPSLQGETPGQPGRPTVVEVHDAGNMPFNPLPPAFRHAGSILCLQFDERIMVTGSSDKTCIIWDIKADWAPVCRLRSHTAGVLDVCFDDKRIVSCSKDMSICAWDRKTGERIHVMTGHRGPVNAVQLRGDLIVSASGDGVAKLWNLASGLCIKEFASRDRGMACVDFSLDSRTVLAGGNDQVIYQFDTSSGDLTREMSGHRGLVRSLHLDNANGRVVSGSYDTSIRTYDLATGGLIVAFIAWTTSWILSAKSDYRRIVAASQDSRVVIMDFGHGVPGIELLME